MEWPDAAALAFSFEEVPHRPGRHRHDETGRLQQWLSGIRTLACEFNEAMAHQRCLADEQMAGLRITLVPLHHCLARPQTSRFADHPMRDTLHHRIALPCSTGFKHWTCHVPLQHMHSATQGMGQVGELMTQQALARTRQTSKEHAALFAGQPLQVGIEPWVCCGNEERMWAEV